MNGITIKKLSDVAPYAGPSEISGIRFRPLRGALGVTAWGMNVLELEPNCTGYPEHDHEKDGQEEVYVILSGAVVLQADGAEVTLEAGDSARVACNVKRKLVTREQSASILAIGGTPGKAFEVTM